MSTKKRRMEYISFYNHTGLEEHFTKMAKKGWLIENISNFYWTYRKIEPKDLHFCVTYYPRASDFDPGPSEEQQTFHDFCAHTGWQLTCTWHQMQVFYNEKENPVPLETDPLMEVETLHKACKKNFLPSYFLLLALGLLMAAYFVARIFADPIGLVSDPSHLMTGTAYVCMAIISITELLSYFLWYTKAKRAAEHGIFVETPSTAAIQKFIVIVVAAAFVAWVANILLSENTLMKWVVLVMLVYMVALFAIVNGIKYGLKKLKASRGLNKALTLTACFILPFIMMTCLSVLVLSIVSRTVPEDKVVVSLGEYENREFFTSGGSQDYTDYAKYYYSSANVAENKYLKQIQETEFATINMHFNDFEGWIETIKRSDASNEVVINYDFDRKIIDTEDFIYIDSEEHTWSDGHTSLISYNIYFFDAQTQVLYYFHNNI